MALPRPGCTAYRGGYDPKGREETAMKALQYTRIGSPPEVVEVPTPEPEWRRGAPAGACRGACHSDEFIMGLPEEAYVYGLPLTLGHEGVGVVEAVGPAVTGVQVGRAVAVYGPWGCGRCHACATGAEKYCDRSRPSGDRTAGPGRPGRDGRVHARRRRPSPRAAGRARPGRQAVPLTDAGLTPYHAIEPSLAQARRPERPPSSSASAVWVTWRSGCCAPCPRARSSRSTCPSKLDFAREIGAHHAVASDGSAPAEVKAAHRGAWRDRGVRLRGPRPDHGALAADGRRPRRHRGRRGG